MDAMLRLSAAAVSMYDAVFYTSDTFNPQQPGDHFRDKVANQQNELDMVLRETANRAGLVLIDIPRGLTTTERVTWISARLDEEGVRPALL